MSAPLGRTYTRDRGAGGGEEDAGRAAFVVIALECDRPLAPSTRHALDDVDEVILGRAGDSSRAATRTGNRLELRIPDNWMSGAHARLVRQLGRWVVEDMGSKNGTLVNGEPRATVVLEDGDLVELGHTFLYFREVLGAAPAAPDELAARAPGLATFAPGLARDLADLERVARASLPVVVEGRTGTGKEMIARAVHELSGRAGPFVAVNSGAIPANLVESELFGYRRGAFSGALEDRAGLVRSAHGGTLFLDELGDLPAAAQAALLRVLQEREVTPIGSARPIPVDIQLVAATQRPLRDLVADGRLREDLFARLSGFTIRVPPLCQRREDLGLIAGALLHRLGAGESLRLDPEAARALFAHDWPLNVRELERCLALAIALSGGELIRREHLPPEVRDDEPAAQPEPLALSEADRARRDELMELLREHDGNLSAVARASGKARTQIQRWVKRFGLDPGSFRR